jgi:hypothetical protein
VARSRTPRKNRPLVPSTCHNRTSRIVSGTVRVLPPNRGPARGASCELERTWDRVRQGAAVATISDPPSCSTSLSRRSHPPENSSPVSPPSRAGLSQNSRSDMLRVDWTRQRYRWICR